METWKADSKGRLDVFLAAQAGISRMQSGKLVREGSVKVNGRLVKKSAHMVLEGDDVEASLEGLKVTETHLLSDDLSLAVLYEDDACMVLNKPAGISVHPAIGIPRSTSTVLHGIAHLFGERKIPFAASHVLVHRLDKDTTGCLLVAKTGEAHRMLQEQFAQRSVKKSYLAIVAGIPHPAHATIDASIGRSAADRTKMSVLGSTKSREARTSYRTLATSDDAALLLCDLHTGRTHQIRVHLQAIHHPILGDTAYTNAASERLTEQCGIEHLGLHAYRLSFTSPADSQEHTVHAPPPSSFLSSLKHAGIAWEAGTIDA